MSKTRILIADDDPSIRRLLTTLARREEIEVDAAADGEEAIEYLQTNDYAVVLLDLMMPKVNGFGVIDFLRDHRRSPKPVVFVISAFADTMYRSVDESIVAGVLHKPFDVTEVASLIRHIVKGWNEDQAAGLRNSRERSIREFIERSERRMRGGEH